MKRFYKSSIVIFAVSLLLSVNAKSMDGKYLPSQYAEHENKINRMVGFLEHILNTVGNDNTPNKDKSEIINSSYLKVFLNPEVQIEDDLDQKRSVIINKNVQAYLQDVDFFYKDVSFEFSIDDITLNTSSTNQKYFKVKTSRLLKGLSLEGEQVDASIERFIEINFNEANDDLKIASIYTTKLTSAETLKRWWDATSFEWKVTFKRAIQEENEPSTEQLKKITKLKSLDISFNKYITDFSPLTMLENLEELNISHTKLQNLNDIRNLKQLKTLNISNTAISNLDGLTYMKNLEDLFFEDTKVESIQPLFNLKNLKHVYCKNTQVPGFEINALTDASASVEVNHNISTTSSWWGDVNDGWKDVFAAKVTFAGYEPSISELSVIENLEEIDISNRSDITSLRPLQHLKNLKKLSIKKSGISSLELIGSLRNLEELDMSENWITDINPLYQLENLKVVNMDEIQASDEDIEEYVARNSNTKVIHKVMESTIWFIKLPEVWKTELKKSAGYDGVETLKTDEIFDLFYITSIDLSGKSDIESLEPISKLKNLEELNIANTMKISDLEPLRGLPRLRHLDCSFNPVEDLTPLEDLGNLKFLNVSNTYVSSLSGLKKMFSLEKLYMTSSKVNDLKDVRNLANLKELKFSSTNVKSLAPLITLMDIQFIECYNTKIDLKEVNKFKEIKPDTKIVFY